MGRMRVDSFRQQRSHLNDEFLFNSIFPSHRGQFVGEKEEDFSLLEMGCQFWSFSFLFYCGPATKF
jgi:hypothetical protein